jgi:FkbM family methyltransferase
LARTAQGLGKRALLSLLRLSARQIPIPGWFPLVVERLHPHLVGDVHEAELQADGIAMRLDLRDYIQRRIFYECHERENVALLCRHLSPGDVVLDVGAHVGLFSIVAANIVGPEGSVHAFEPVPANFLALANNVRLNGFENVVLNNVAVGSQHGRLRLGLPSEVPDTGPTSAMYTAGSDVAAIEVDVVCLDDYVDRHIAATPVTLLKLDVEGGEPDVLAGFARTLSSRPPRLLLTEVNLERLADHRLKAADVLEPLQAYGYDLHRVTLAGRLKPLHPKDVRELTPDDQRREPKGGVLGWARRARTEPQIFFNVVAVQPDVDALLR